MAVGMSGEAVWITAPLPSTVTLGRARAENSRLPLRATTLASLTVIGAAAICIALSGRGSEELDVKLLEKERKTEALSDDPLLAILRGNARMNSDARNPAEDEYVDESFETKAQQRMDREEKEKERSANAQRAAESIVAHLAAEDRPTQHPIVAVSQRPVGDQDAEHIVASLARKDGFSEHPAAAKGSDAFSVPPKVSLAAIGSVSLSGPPAVGMHEELSRADDEQGLTGFQPDTAATQAAVQSLLEKLDFSAVGGASLLRAALRGEATALARYKEGELSWGCQGLGRGGEGGLAGMAGEVGGQLEQLQAEGYERIDAMKAGERRQLAAEEAAAEAVLARVRRLQEVCGGRGGGEAQPGEPALGGGTASLEGGSGGRGGGGGAVQGLRQVEGGAGGVGTGQGEERMLEDRSGIESVAAMITGQGRGEGAEGADRSEHN